MAGTGLKLSASTTIGGSTNKAWIYLFKRSGNLSPGAGKQYVDYAFNLLSGNYKTTYKLQDGPNPENSTVTTPYYTDHFSDRWLHDQLRITTQGSSGVDILDRAKPQFGPGVCGRTEDTFDDAEGAFIANKSGPVRAIRSYIGANSGPLSQREHIFYERREDIRTYLRVHAIPGIMDYFDYAPAANGMTYKNNANTGGVRVDGVPDSVTAGTLAWETVDGGQGGLSIVHTNATDIPGFTSSSYYFDDKTPDSGAETQCTGDATAYGNSGPWITQTIPNTDPRTAGFNSLHGHADALLRRRGQGERRRAQRRGGRADQRHRLELPLASATVQARPAGRVDRRVLAHHEPFASAATELIAPAAHAATHGAARAGALRDPPVPPPERHREVRTAMHAGKLVHAVAFGPAAPPPAGEDNLAERRRPAEPPDRRLSGGRVAPDRRLLALRHGVERPAVAGERKRLALAFVEKVGIDGAGLPPQRLGDRLAAAARPCERPEVAAQGDRAPVGGYVAGRHRLAAAERQPAGATQRRGGAGARSRGHVHARPPAVVLGHDHERAAGRRHEQRLGVVRAVRVAQDEPLRGRR